MPPKRRDLTGQKFGFLTVLKYEGGNKSRWLCQCACGNYRRASVTNLMLGSTKSCGCMKSYHVKKAMRAKGYNCK